MSRRATLVFIHLFLAVQIVGPASYYLWRTDSYDERFAWRMFSPTRMAVCGSGKGARKPPEFAVGGAPIRLGGTFHEAWVNISKRGRRVVIEAMAAKLCADNPGKSVHVTYSCRGVDGVVVPISRGSFDFCKTGAL